MNDRPPGTLLLAAAVTTAVLLMYGLGGSVVAVQMFVISISTPVFIWFELESGKDWKQKAVRLVGMGYWCLSLSFLMTLLIFESVYPFLPSNSWRSFAANTMFSTGTAVSFGFASAAVLQRRVRWTAAKCVLLIFAAFVSYLYNRDFSWFEILLIPALVIVLTFLFRAGERMSESAAPLIHEIAPIYLKLRKMAPRLTVFVVGYLCIIVFFAGAYACINRIDSDSFAGSGIRETNSDGTEIRDGGVSWFLHLSVATGTTLGYGDIYPNRSLARMATSAQVLLSLGWTIIVFTAAIDSTKEASGSDIDS